MATLDTPKNLPGWQHVYSGKVRDLYESETDPRALLIVASNRVSAFDHILEPPIPGKGALLTRLSKWWFEFLDVPNHFYSEPLSYEGSEVVTDAGLHVPASVADRAMLTKKLNMVPIECVVRGAITGSGFKEYEERGSVSGVALPAGLTNGDLLDEAIFTPAYKAPLGEHDENISFEEVEQIVGAGLAKKLKETSLEIFEEARQEAQKRGLLLADTKFEFGEDPETGELKLADEVLTSDSSRYWDRRAYESGTGPERLASFDKQIVRDWLSENWDGAGDPPPLPKEIVDKTRARYEELLNKFLTP